MLQRYPVLEKPVASDRLVQAIEATRRQAGPRRGAAPSARRQ